MCAFVLAHVHVLYIVYGPLPILVQCQWCRTATNNLIQSELEQLLLFRDLFLMSKLTLLHRIGLGMASQYCQSQSTQQHISYCVEVMHCS